MYAQQIQHAEPLFLLLLLFIAALATLAKRFLRDPAAADLLGAFLTLPLPHQR